MNAILPAVSALLPTVQTLTDDIIRVPLSVVNVYMVGREDDWVLIDAGLSIGVERIRAVAREHFNRPPRAILLTHGHFDHIGALPALLREWDVPVYAHEMELPYLSGRCAYPPADPAVGGGAMALLSRFYDHGPMNLGSQLRPLPRDGSIPEIDDWHWIPTPGHSPGHVAFFRERDRTLIAGDAIVSQRQESLLAALTRWPHKVCPPPAYFTCDWIAARDSVQTIAGLEPELALTGHGLPLRGEKLRQGLQELLDHWCDRIPSYGRYVKMPALTNMDGVISVPPAVPDRQGIAMAVIAGISIIAGSLWWRNRH